MQLDSGRTDGSIDVDAEFVRKLYKKQESPFAGNPTLRITEHVVIDFGTVSVSIHRTDLDYPYVKTHLFRLAIKEGVISRDDVDEAFK